jgi:hypothetical protein
MVRRFYPDHLVMQEHGAHGPAPETPEQQPEPVADAVPATNGNGHVPAGELRPSGELEGVGER